jgi:hypothetical protein
MVGVGAPTDLSTSPRSPMSAKSDRKSSSRQTLRDLLKRVDAAPVERQADLRAAVARAAASAGISVEELREYALGPRQYGHNGLAGCVEQRRSRITGSLVGLYEAGQAGLDEDAGRWATVCEDHATSVNHATLATARSHMADPSLWCESCREPKDTGFDK